MLWPLPIGTEESKIAIPTSHEPNQRAPHSDRFAEAVSRFVSQGVSC
jgi:hypothetical protein